MTKQISNSRSKKTNSNSRTPRSRENPEREGVKTSQGQPGAASQSQGPPVGASRIRSASASQKGSHEDNKQPTGSLVE